MTTRAIAAAGWVAAGAAVAASAGDLLLLAVATPATPALAVGTALGRQVLVIGHYLGVLAIPLYALGYRYVGDRLGPPYARPLTALGLCGGIVGGTIHGVTSVAIAAGGLGAATQLGSSPVPASSPFAAYILPLWAIVTAAVLAGSVAFTIAVMRGNGDYVRWMALASPAALVVVIGACASVSSAARALIAPAAPNLARVAFFALASANVTRRRSADSPDAARRRSSSASP